MSFFRQLRLVELAPVADRFRQGAGRAVRKVVLVIPAHGVHIHLTLPEDKIGAPFWPWREEAVPEVLHSCPGGDYYLEVWDVFVER